MGIYIYMAISKSVTKTEWQRVYRETVRLINHFPLVEYRRACIQGIDVNCLVKTKSRGDSRRSYFDSNAGWTTIGDSNSLWTGEDYFFPKELVNDTPVHDSGDALLDALNPSIIGWDEDDERLKNFYHIWGNKTQGFPYHTYILAVAALVEARLGPKAFTYGDITKGQFAKAVRVANEFLDTPIDLPDSCDADRFLKRVLKLPFSKEKQLAVFKEQYLGDEDREFGEALRKNFSKRVTNKYWKDEFEGVAIRSKTFDKLVGDYLLWGFDLKDLCRLVNFESCNSESKYEDFVTRIMDAKLHIKEKDCSDPLKPSSDGGTPYGIGMQFAQLLFGSCRNKKVDRYIPIEEIRAALKKGLSIKCDVDSIIDSYLEKEKNQTKVVINSESSIDDINEALKHDPSDALKCILSAKKKEYEDRKQYDLTEYEKLPFYKKGDSIIPGLEACIVRSAKFLNTVPDDFYRSLLKTPKKCCEWLAENNHSHLLLLDKHWDTIFSNIKQDINSFARYYSIFRLCVNNNDEANICVAFLINDDLYNHCQELINSKNKQDSTPPTD